MGEAFTLVQRNLNFTYTAVKSVDGLYGRRVKSPRKGSKFTYNGLIGMLERDEIDLAVGDLSFTSERAQVSKNGVLRIKRNINVEIVLDVA